MSILNTIQDMNQNKFLFQKIKYNFTKEYKEKEYKEKYIKTKQNLLEYILINKDKKYNKSDLIKIIGNKNINHKLINYVNCVNCRHKNIDIFTYLSFGKINIDTILLFIDNQWNWEDISLNENIIIENIFMYHHLNWDYKELLKNPNLTMEIFEQIYSFYDEVTKDYINEITYNPNITINIIEKYKNIKWDWDAISNNIKNLSLEYYKKYIDKWDHKLLSFHIDFKIFNLYNFMDWDYEILSGSRYLDFDIVIKNIHKEWNWSHISLNKNLTIEIIDKYKLLNWDWNILSYNYNINIDFVKNNIDKNWNMFYLSANPAITMDDIKNNNLKWDKNGILLNPNITKEIIEKYIDYYGFNIIYDNQFLYNDKAFEIQIKKDRKKRADKICYLLQKYTKNLFNENILNHISSFIDYY